jgi:perosamine synthetase
VSQTTLPPSSAPTQEVGAIKLFRPRVREAAIQQVVDVLRSGWMGMGPKTLEFERDFAGYIGTTHCVGLSSCTAALHIAVRLLDLPPDSEVITTPVTFVSTNHVLLYEHLRPVFADVQRLTGNIDPHAVENRITPNTRAIMAMHYGGYPCDLDELYALGHRHGIPIIEDCAHACGASYRGKRIGSHGEYHAFSFHAVKNLPMGDGGALLLSSEDQDAHARRLRWLGIDKDTFQRSDGSTKRTYSWDYDVTDVGFKYHMNDIHAAIGVAQLPYLDEDNGRRAEIAEIYSSELAGCPGITLLSHSDDRQSSHHLFCALAERRDDLVDKLRAHNVAVGVHYKRNDQYPMYEAQDLPNAEYFSSHAISLPVHLDLTDDEALRVARLIREGW